MRTLLAVAVLLLAAGCPKNTCEYNGQSYSEGESFPATDGCNTCTCGPEGQVGCTKIGCSAE